MTEFSLAGSPTRRSWHRRQQSSREWWRLGGTSGGIKRPDLRRRATFELGTQRRFNRVALTSVLGTFRTWSDVRLESGMRSKADVKKSAAIGSLIRLSRSDPGDRRPAGPASLGRAADSLPPSSAPITKRPPASNSMDGRRVRTVSCVSATCHAFGRRCRCAALGSPVEPRHRLSPSAKPSFRTGQANDRE